MTDEVEVTTLDVESAAQGLLRQEPEGQPETEEVADVTEAEDEVEVEDDEDVGEVDIDQAEDDDEVEAEDTDEAEEAEDDDEDPLIDIKGEDVAFSEVVNGYLRQKDYTQKTQALAEERRKFDSEVEQVKQHLQHQNAQLKDALATFAISQDQEPDWDNLEGKEYDLARRDWDKKQARKKEAAEAYQALKQQQHQQTLERETAALMQAFPEWTDQTVMRDRIESITTTAQNYGFSPEEVASITDHRMIKVMDRLQKLEAKSKADKANNAKVAKRVAKAAKKPTSTTKPAKNQDADKARRQKMDRLKKTGSVEDAALAILMEQ